MIVGTGNSPVLTVNLQLASSLRLFFVLKKIDHYAKQFGNLTKSKVASTADNLARQLRHADNTLSKVVQNFSLNNIGFEPQLVRGAIPTPPPSRLSGVADNLQAFAKNLDGSVDEVG
ncbi:TPA: hypothetical protein U1W01_001755 [Streptococcus suis]|nr:hypothetical protein [Streptococcus suis]HEM4071341.1 hypothetical protein [Streptococcus suis]